jgi:hypothetical protein
MADDGFKDEVTATLRRLILQRPGLRETDSAEAGLTTLSFEGLNRPRRSVWIDTDLKGRTVVDLESEGTEGEPYRSVAQLVPADDLAAVAVVEAWLGGSDLEQCLALAPKKS